MFTGDNYVTCFVNRQVVKTKLINISFNMQDTNNKFVTTNRLYPPSPDGGTLISFLFLRTYEYVTSA